MPASIAAAERRRRLVEAMLDVRLARPADLPAIHECDASDLEASPALLHQAVAERNCWVAVLDFRIVGYLVLQSAFFASGRITRFAVHPAFRNRGIGTALVAFAEIRCPSLQLFVSVKHTDRIPRLLLCRRGFTLSGVREQSFDPGRMLVYGKQVAGIRDIPAPADSDARP
ncbi:MAG: GNAT family N-acetyltransferase [Candidatus Eisenbacteria bacterium]